VCLRLLHNATMPPRLTSTAQPSFISAAEMRQRATTAKRVAAGMESLLAAGEWSEKDRKILQQAAAILRSGAQTTQIDSARKKQEEARRDELDAYARSLLATTFGSMSTVADKVALLAAQSPSDLRPRESGGLLKLTRRFDAEYLLGTTFRDTIDYMAYRLRPSPIPDRAGMNAAKAAMEAKASEVWSKFQGMRESLAATHAPLIAKIESLLAETTGKRSE